MKVFLVFNLACYFLVQSGGQSTSPEYVNSTYVAEHEPEYELDLTDRKGNKKSNISLQNTIEL